MNYNKQDNYNFEIDNFPLLERDLPYSPSYDVYISQHIRFARVCSNDSDFIKIKTKFKLGVFHANQISMCLDPHLN